MTFRTVLKGALIALPIGVTFWDTCGYVARVDGTSMQPALNPNKQQTDYVYLNRLAVYNYEFNRGDVVSIISPKDPAQKIIKRVVGIEGDTVETLSYKSRVVKIPEGHCWVEGDHTGHSMDSNNFGPISAGLVYAKASYIVWPPSRWQSLQSYLPESRTPLNVTLNKLEFQFMGNVARNALTLGDVDNDGCIELIIGNNKGEVSIFKGKEKVQTIPDLGFVCCVAVGNVLNRNINHLVIITTDGWCFIYEHPVKTEVPSETEKIDEESSQCDEQSQLGEKCEDPMENFQLKCIHTQRIPANTKNIVLGDIDNDGLIEMILGLTDRVVRTYRWHDGASKSQTGSECGLEDSSQHLGKFVALNKWECANQIGSITLHHSDNGKPSLLIAQPGGTFMRIRCQTEDSVAQIQESLESGESSSAPTETITGSTVDYQFLGISRMRNQNISTEILGDFKTGNLEGSENDGKKKCPYAVATLDGTIMLVQDEVILWAIAVDHQVFALTKVDITGNGMDDIVVCSWDGETYILDQDKNSVRFHLDEPVQAFHSGHYNLSTSEPPVTCLVYVTFKNTVNVYYDIPLQDLVCRKFEPDVSQLINLFVKDGKTQDEATEIVNNLDKKKKARLIQYLLYNTMKS